MCRGSAVERKNNGPISRRARAGGCRTPQCAHNDFSDLACIDLQAEHTRQFRGYPDNSTGPRFGNFDYSIDLV
jgi:hypothetical protein